MEQYTSQEEIRRTIINDMAKKRNSIVTVIGEDTIVYKNILPSRCVYSIFGQADDSPKWGPDENLKRKVNCNLLF